MSKSFKIARKPGAVQGSVSTSATQTAPEVGQKTRLKAGDKADIAIMVVDEDRTTRKTIEVPEGYFFKVKMLALQRRIKEKELWAEILAEYFRNHPTL